jgi:hypothetical protein
MILVPGSPVTRSAIKAYMVDRLKTVNEEGAYPTLAGGRVFDSRFGPLQSEELPAIVVYAVEETSAELDTSQDRRTLKIDLEIQASGDDADTQLDLISDQAAALFRDDRYLGGPRAGLVERCRYVRGQIYYDERRHLDSLAWVMEYEVEYLYDTTPSERAGLITPFRGADVTYADVCPPPAIETTGSVIDIPQP